MGFAPVFVYSAHERKKPNVEEKSQDFNLLLQYSHQEAY